MRAPTIHESVQACVAASSSLIWFAHHYAQDLECVAAIAVSIVAALATDIEHAVFRFVREHREHYRRELESEL